MATVRDYTDPYVETFRTVPRDGDCICPVCHGVRSRGFYDCYSCGHTREGLSFVLDAIVPVSLCENNSQFHWVMRSYKDGLPEVAQQHTRQVAAVISRFMSNHTACLENAFGQWDVVTHVPSPKRDVHPLQTVLSIAPAVKGVYRPLLRSGPGEIGHNTPSDKGFTVSEDVRGVRVLLVDDMLTSGSRIRSAASSLTVAGATVAAGVPIGRFIHADWSDDHAALCEWAAKTVPFDFERCALCGPSFP